MEHPSILALGEAANDLVTWSNVSPFALIFSHAAPADGVCGPQDIFSYNVEQSKGKYLYLEPFGRLKAYSRSIPIYR